MDNYFELRVRINTAIEEVFSDICFENLDCEGIVLAEEEYDDTILLSSTQGTIKAFLKSIDGVKTVLKTNRELLLQRGYSDVDLGSWDFEIIEVENQDWSKKWKENWEVTHVGQNIAIVPSWIEYKPNEGETIIALDPGSAFGTGTHPTTQLCMLAIEKYVKVDDEMADIGCGSGILAICATKFGAASAVGIDNDELVIEVAKENAMRNKACCKCLFEFNTADKLTDKFDFISANILHNILADIMPDLKVIMKDNAKMVLSGILDEKKQVVLDAIAQNDLKVVEETHQDVWVAFVVKR